MCDGRWRSDYIYKIISLRLTRPVMMKNGNRVIIINVFFLPPCVSGELTNGTNAITTTIIGNYIIIYYYYIYYMILYSVYAH